MRNYASIFTTRPLLIASILLALLAFSACNSDSSDDNNSANSANNPDTVNNQGNTQTNGLTLSHNGQSMNANTTVSATNTFSFENKGTLMTTIIAGWANPALDAKFGTITSRINLTGTAGQAVTAGTYTLNKDESVSQSARLAIQNPELGLPTSLVAQSGTLTVETIDLTGNTLGGLNLKFDGIFKNIDETDTNEYKLSGSLKYSK